MTEQFRRRVIRLLQFMVGRTNKSLSNTPLNYKNYFDRPLKVNVQATTGQHVFLDRVSKATQSAARRLADAPHMNLLSKSIGPFRVLTELHTQSRSTKMIYGTPFRSAVFPLPRDPTRLNALSVSTQPKQGQTIRRMTSNRRREVQATSHPHTTRNMSLTEFSGIVTTRMAPSTGFVGTATQESNTCSIPVGMSLSTLLYAIGSEITT